MAEHPMFPLWTDAYLGDTHHLTTLEHGAYLLLLIAMWRTSSKDLPNDDKKLAKYAHLTPAQWHRIKPTIIAFFEIDGDRITQPRLTDEAEAVRRHSQSQSNKAKARWLKQKETDDAAAMPGACSLPTTTTTKTQTEPFLRVVEKDSDSSLRSESCPASAGRALALKPPPFDEIWKLQRLPGQKRGKGNAEKAWAKACKRELPERIIEAFAQHQACWERFGWEVEFIPHLATWLNQGRWQDDLPRPRSEGNGHERYRRPSAVQSLWNEYTEARGRAAGFGEGDDQPLLAHSQEARGRGGSSRAPEALPGRFTEIS